MINSYYEYSPKELAFCNLIITKVLGETSIGYDRAGKDTPNLRGKERINFKETWMNEQR